MIDINLIREHPEKVKKTIADRNGDPSLVDAVLALDETRRNLIGQVQDLRAERNSAAKERNIERGKEIKEELKVLEPQLADAEEKYIEILQKVPNAQADDVPLGKTEDDNVVIRSWGEPSHFDFEPKDHLDLGVALDLVDVEKSADISGARFFYLKNDAVRLQFAIIQFVFETLTNKEVIAEIAEKVGVSANTFVPMLPPVMIKKEVAQKMDRFYPDEISYHLEKDDLVLIGSAEHSLGPYHMDETFAEKDLPLRYVGYSTSFRREAGTYGKDMRGILRTHHFDKLEMESFTTAEDGEKEQEFFVAIQEYLVQQLGIPYQVMYICTGDMGKPDYRQYDINCWLPGQGKYRETHTSDYMTDYQSRQLNTKVQHGGESELVHMNDATAFALGRIIIAIFENYQQKDGSVKIPEVLQKWMGGKEVISR